jgi:hypothetical protein
MRTGDPRRWRLGGWRGRGKERTGWWKASDGRSYPPEAARHPAARDEPAAPRPTPPRQLAAAGPLWLVALVPMALVVAVVIGGLADTAPPDRVETFGSEGPGDPGKSTDGRPASRVSAASVSASVDSEAVEAAVPSRGGSVGRTGTPIGPADPDDAADAADEAGDRDDGAADASPPPPAAPAPPASSETTAPPTPTTPTPVATPRSRDDCQHGRWEHLVDDQGRPFANQGLCVSYVNAAG